jgi:molybdopterin converting factor small subunit
MPVVLIPTAYRGPTQGQAEINVPVGSVISALEAVEAAHPGFLPQVVDPSGNVHRFVKLFINEAQIDSAALDTRLGDSDRLEVLAAIAGG